MGVSEEQVRQKPAKAEDVTADMIAWIRANYRPTDSGIIYCQTRKVRPPCTLHAHLLTHQLHFNVLYVHSSRLREWGIPIHLKHPAGGAGINTDIWNCRRARA